MYRETVYYNELKRRWRYHRVLITFNKLVSSREYVVTKHYPRNAVPKIVCQNLLTMQFNERFLWNLLTFIGLLNKKSCYLIDILINTMGRLELLRTLNNWLPSTLLDEQENLT